MIKHVINVVKSLWRESGKRSARSSQWPKVEKEHLRTSPSCAACGSTNRVQVHHVRPFHLHPELELDPKNLVSLCMDTKECHLLIGHGDDFKAYNPNVLEDASEALLHDDRRPAIAARAKKARLY
jgi:hypothetical protein